MEVLLITDPSRCKVSERKAKRTGHPLDAACCVCESHHQDLLDPVAKEFRGTFSSLTGFPYFQVFPQVFSRTGKGIQFKKIKLSQLDHQFRHSSCEKELSG